MAPRTANRQSESKYTGIYLRASTQSYYCELHFLGSGNREKRVKFFRNCPSYDLALLISDAARYYMRSFGSFKFNLTWSESVIESRCVARTQYESLHTAEEKKMFVQKQTNALISFFTKFNSGISQVLSPAHPQVLSPAGHEVQTPADHERHGTDTPLDDSHSHETLETESTTICGEIVWLQHQAVNRMYLEDMIRLRSMMLHCKNTKPMPPDQVQNLNQHISKLKGMISFMELPREELPPDRKSVV